ncbi:hypothetical protein DPEC_G00259260 [Dallia pectoralis]|uniref:Uncharacterized protein n=1 Tax=Dallia pectoralis TaxID=75939 RepID=A0ACC2FQY9_DALPE|nr:hypothetical protein DPEC_G00259260 [Dallia pectoralis]
MLSQRWTAVPVVQIKGVAFPKHMRQQGTRPSQQVAAEQKPRPVKRPKHRAKTPVGPASPTTLEPPVTPPTALRLQPGHRRDQLFSDHFRPSTS